MRIWDITKMELRNAGREHGESIEIFWKVRTWFFCDNGYEPRDS